MQAVIADLAPLPHPPSRNDGLDRALFLDVDGTLLDFASRPDGVSVDPQLQDDLALVATRMGGAVALLSGRPLAQLDALFAWQRKPAAGLHGAELRMPDGTVRTLGDGNLYERLQARARAWLEAVPGNLVLEDKQRALAVHYRHAPGARDAAERIARRLLQEAGSAYALQHGDHVIELKPAAVDKGRALAALMGVPPFAGRKPWMLGDDLTDEDAFQRANTVGGTSVIVGARRPTAAHYALGDPAAVRTWLHALAHAPSA